MYDMDKTTNKLASISILTAGILGLSASWSAAGRYAHVYPPAVAPEVAVEWVTIEGGKFLMGNPNGYDTKPVHEATVPTFAMSKTLVTVEQYAECVSAGQCAAPDTGYACNWGKTDRDRRRDPVNCVDFDRASQFANFMDARLPSETEWEYAAKSAGQDRKYPWGDAVPSCDRAVINGNGGDGCGTKSTMPVCSKPAGNTAQGLCDMAGNTREWMQDKYQQSYAETPVDGSAYEVRGSGRVLRGGAFSDSDDFGMSTEFRTDSRRYGNPYYRDANLGIRLAKSTP